MKLIASILILASSYFSIAFAQHTPIGIWKTINDKTGEAQSYVEVYEKNGKVFGKIIQLLQDPADTKCDKCTGAKKNQLIVDMIIISDLQFSKGYWKNGSILDPESGNEYNCSIWLEANKPDELKVRGKHWTGLYRTQTWYKVK